MVAPCWLSCVGGVDAREDDHRHGGDGLAHDGQGSCQQCPGPVWQRYSHSRSVLRAGFGRRRRWRRQPEVGHDVGRAEAGVPVVCGPGLSERRHARQRQGWPWPGCDLVRVPATVSSSPSRGPARPSASTRPAVRPWFAKGRPGVLGTRAETSAAWAAGVILHAGAAWRIEVTPVGLAHHSFCCDPLPGISRV